MAHRTTTEEMIVRLEKSHKDIRFIDSQVNGLYYATAPGDDRIMLLCGGGRCILTLEQLYAVSKEAFEIWDSCIDEKAKKIPKYEKKAKKGYA